eukprot:GHVU01068203.1.p2 GENE.GHVU01068203.1~~GHVU01068203.1.p2  ORF type:complete len:145 (+),score=19.83 GHVU01068203.1:166-600(+)
MDQLKSEGDDTWYPDVEPQLTVEVAGKAAKLLPKVDWISYRQSKWAFVLNFPGFTVRMEKGKDVKSKNFPLRSHGFYGAFFESMVLKTLVCLGLKSPSSKDRSSVEPFPLDVEHDDGIDEFMKEFPKVTLAADAVGRMSPLVVC